MRKYLVAYSIALQEVLQRRASFLMDRLGGLAVVVSLYSFWTSLLGERERFLGYERSEMLAYALLLNVLMSFALTGRGWQLVGEISSGRVSSYLVRPLSYLGYSLALDLAQKSVHAASALIEVALLVLLTGSAVRLPAEPSAWLFFIASAVLASLLFFFMEFIVSALAFWTSESGGPLFCFTLFVQFCAGAFFPLDVLPDAMRRALLATPFPSMAFLPAQLFLGRLSGAAAWRALAVEAAWAGAFAALAAAAWRRGVASYSAEGG